MQQDRGQGSDPADSLRFAHLTDPHLTFPGEAAVGDLLNKRMLGYLSWQRRRRHEHRAPVLAAMVADLKDREAEHVAVTGDLTHLGLPEECREALAWLETLGPPERVSLVPGNHDRYVRAPRAETLGLWDEYLASEMPDPGHASPFPTVKVRGPVAFIGLSSAAPSPPLMATGLVGGRQRRRLDALLAWASEQGLFRVVLVHHAPVPSSYRWRKRLVDGRETMDVIQAQGAELVLHGHTHRITRTTVPGPQGRVIPVIGLPSASATMTSAERAARYSLWTVRRAGNGFSVNHCSRVYDALQGEFRDIGDWNPLL